MSDNEKLSRGSAIKLFLGVWSLVLIASQTHNIALLACNAGHDGSCKAVKSNYFIRHKITNPKYKDNADVESDTSIAIKENAALKIKDASEKYYGYSLTHALNNVSWADGTRITFMNPYQCGTDYFDYENCLFHTVESGHLGSRKCTGVYGYYDRESNKVGYFHKKNLTILSDWVVVKASCTEWRG